MSGPTEVAVVIVCYNGRDYLGDCLSSVLASDDGLIHKHVIVVDNASQDGSEDFVRCAFPQVTLLAAGSNLGFAGANNLAWRFVAQQFADAKYLYLLNQDTVVKSGWLRPLVNYLQENPRVGIVQSKLLLHPAVDTINTVGNHSHYLGFGFTTAYGEQDQGQYDTPRSIDFASGAGMMVRTQLIRQFGLFESKMFMYLEDADLSWKIRQLGYEVQMVPDSHVYHKYRFNAGYQYYYYLERNRWWLLLVYYRWATLMLLAPALLFMEMGQWVFAIKHGRLSDKLRSYAFFLKPQNGHLIRQLRSAAHERRTIGDAEFLRNFKSTIDSPELQSGLLRYLANPILAAYWAIARRLMFW